MIVAWQCLRKFPYETACRTLRIRTLPIKLRRVSGWRSTIAPAPRGPLITHPVRSSTWENMLAQYIFQRIAGSSFGGWFRRYAHPGYLDRQEIRSQSENGIFRQNHASLNCVLQFADVLRPVSIRLISVQANDWNQGVTGATIRRRDARRLWS